MASQLGVSRGTVVSAYDQLMGEGYLTAEVGSGTRVHPGVLPQSAPQPALALAKPAPEKLINLRPGQPDTSKLITPAWRAAWREAAAHPLAPADPQGLPEFRAEIAQHLRLMRGVPASAEHIFVTAGTREGFALVLRALGQVRIGVESPGYPSLRPLIPHVVDVPVDRHGMLPPPTLADAVLVTPSHQYPLGGSMSAKRRSELAAWARDTGAWIIEDDFDAELRYVGQPLPALAAVAPERTVLLGTFSTLVAPSIACGYVVAPPELAGVLRVERELAGMPVGAITQKALAGYLGAGALRRHVASMRRKYKRKRDAVAAALGGLPGARLLPIEAGLHAVLLLDEPAERVVERARAAGLKLTALADYWGASEGVGADNGIVFGFGHLAESELDGVLATLARVAQSGG